LKHANSKNPWIPSPIPFFMIGFFYYLISPYFTLLYFRDDFLVLEAIKYIDLDFYDHFYWLDALTIFTFFLIGYKTSYILKTNSKSIIDKSSNFKVTPLIIASLLFIYLILIFYKIKSKGVVLFSGYSSYDISILGPIATLIFTLAFFFNFFNDQRVKKIFIVLFLFSSIILLGFGSRMFFVLGFISITLGILSKKPYLLKNFNFISLLILLLFIVVGVGVWRSGYSLNNGEALVSIFLIEPLFTATSGSLYLMNIEGRPFFNYPLDTLAALINFIPSFIYPDKLLLIKKLTFNEYIETPFGANALIANLYSNFGFLYPLYILFIGFFYGYLKVRSYTSYFFRAVYLSVLPVLMLHFFREGFITFFKVVFFNGLILPFIMLACLQLLLQNRKVS